MKTILVALMFAALALAQPTVAVSGSVLEATGSASVGSVTISWPTFVAHNGQPVIAGSREFRPGSGTLSATLYPGNYTVVYRFQNGSTTTMRWVVPVGAPWTRTIAEVQTTFVSTPTNYPLPIAMGGTGSTTFTASRCIHMNAAGTAFESTGSDCGGVGTVTSVALALPAIFSVSGSPVTGAGTLTATLANQPQGIFLGSPASSTGTPSFRQVLGSEVANTPSGGISSATVQAAINEIYEEKQTADPDLAVIASLVGIDGQVMYRSGGSWTTQTLVKADVGLGNVDNTSDATKNAATATLTNKTITTPIITSYTVATLPGSPTTGMIAPVTDAATAGSCTSGGGSAKSLCRYNGGAWESIGDGGSGGGSSVVATFAASATSGTLTHNFGSATHQPPACVETSAGIQVLPSSITLGTNADTINFTGGLVAETKCYATTGGGGGGGGGGLLSTNNLSDVASASTSRTNLGLGGAAVLNVGTSVGTVAAGDDSRFPTSAEKAALPQIRKRALGAAFSNPATGVVQYVRVQQSCTITGWSMISVGGSTPTATIDVWKVAAGTSLPTVANTITASAKPAISTGSAIFSSTLTGWTTSLSENDIAAFKVDAVSGAPTQLQVMVHCTI